MPPLASGHGTGAATYSFSSHPKPVTASRKYRDPNETDVAVYRDLKETCITWDKRVHRGNTYGMYTQNAIKEALQEATQNVSPKPRTKRKPKEPAIFDMPLPEKERIPVDLTAHLVAKEEVIEVDTVEAQTDEFLPEPPPEQYQPPKTGVDVHTQVEDGELFNFDFEVEPILDVLVNKTLEQSIMEVEEEHEMQSMTEFKDGWYRQQEAMMKDWQVQVQDEWKRWEEKEAIVNRKREEKRREAQVLLKIQAMSAAKQHLSGLVPNAVSDLKEQAFPDEQGMAIDRIFLPQLLGQVQQEIHNVIRTRQQVDQVVAGCFRANQGAHARALAEHSELTADLERKRYEEKQIRQGIIRALVDDGAGNQKSLGPIEISFDDSMAELENRVIQWLNQNEPDLEQWQHGVVLSIDGRPIEEARALFTAKAGQISMMPKSPPEEDEEEGVEEEGGE